MRSFRRCYPIPWVLLLIAFGARDGACADGAYLAIAGHAANWGGSCESGSLQVLAGSHYFLTVWNAQDQPAQPLTPGWPEGYRLEAALEYSRDVDFTPTPGLMERLAAVQYLDQLNRGAEQDLLHRANTFRRHEDLNAKRFVVTIPADLAGHTITFRARYDKDTLRLVSRPTSPITVIAPCDRTDSAHVLATAMYYAWDRGDAPAVLALADSMLILDYSYAPAWSLAERIAVARQQYDKALAYFERLFLDFGVFGASFLAWDPRPFDRGGVRSPERQAQFEQRRSELLKARAEQEQQTPR